MFSLAWIRTSHILLFLMRDCLFNFILHLSAGAVVTFNGVKTIWAKTRLAAKLGLGGVMIWEVGQDCRLEPVRRVLCNALTLVAAD